MKLVLTSALLGALLLISGCGTQCESTCASFNACKVDSNPPERFVQVDCANFCAGVAAVNARAGRTGNACETEWNEHMVCWSQNRGEICNSDFAGCNDSATAWETCVSDYCATLGADDYDPACAGGEIAFFSPFQEGF